MARFLAAIALLFGACMAVKNGCWKDGVKDLEVFNCTPLPPKHICAACPLKMKNVEISGDFSDCKCFQFAQPAAGSGVSLTTVPVHFFLLALFVVHGDSYSRYFLLQLGVQCCLWGMAMAVMLALTFTKSYRRSSYVQPYCILRHEVLHS